MKNLPQSLVLRCCRALTARDKLCGDWPDHRIPDSFYELLHDHYPDLEHQTNWVSVLETVVRQQAVHLLLEYHGVMVKFFGDIERSLRHIHDKSYTSTYHQDRNYILCTHDIARSVLENIPSADEITKS